MNHIQMNCATACMTYVDDHMQSTPQNKNKTVMGVKLYRIKLSRSEGEVK